jgi:3-hydroxyisobutyrate dehydrogenase-like beta-hydroxyacid dehydrogenase
MKIGVIGLGAMGGAFARNLHRAGHLVIAWNRSAEPLESFRREGGEIAESIEAAFAADLTLSMLADDQVYRSLFVESGLLDRLPRFSLHAVMATISVAFAREFSAAHAERGLSYVAAPVLGNSVIAREAKVHVLAAGDPAALDRARAAFDAIGLSVRSFGAEPYRANVAKIVANFVLGSAVETLGEALAFGRAYDVAPEKIVEMLTGTTFAAPAYRIYGEAMLKERYEPAAFRLSLAGKDIHLALQAAGEASTRLPMAEVVRDAVADAVRHGDGDKDFSALAKVSARRTSQR